MFNSFAHILYAQIINLGDWFVIVKDNLIFLALIIERDIINMP